MDTNKIVDISCYILGAVFGLAGSLKLYPWNKEGHTFMITKFAKWNAVFPLAPLGYIPDPHLYRLSVGTTEVGLAALIIFGPRRVRRDSAVILMLMMVGAIQTLVCSNEVADMGPAVTCFFLSGFVVYRYSTGNSPPKSKKQ